MINPLWVDTLESGWQYALSFGGMIIIVLTVKKLLLELKIREAELKKLSKSN